MPENLLRHETSPYLLQHSHNPVHWRPWGPDALAEAASLDRPILLSIGYAACHWCHVMAHESFEDPATADLMNRLFVNIKVDREERPDIDQIYMAALHALGDQGGWPLTMFLTPSGEPIWGGTYFPRDARYGKPAFKTVLTQLAEIFRSRPEDIDKNRRALMSHLEAAPEGDAVALGPEFLDRAADRLNQLMDPERGGVRGAPKFPQASLLRFLWRAGQRTGDAGLQANVVATLRFLSLGGIYDHIGGGLSRYSVDDRWLVPHFEKMLYDNAQFIERLTAAWLSTPDPLFVQRIEETVGWLRAVMRKAGGAYSASLDADAAGHEGSTYVWSPDEVAAVIGDAAEEFCRVYDITPSGNFEGKSIPNLLSGELPDESVARGHRQSLLQARNRRPQPALDDKILADWNALLIAALADAGFHLDRPEWIADAEQAYRFIRTAMLRDGRPGHSWRDDRLVFPGFATDVAGLARAALELHQVTGSDRYLADAVDLMAQLDRHYRAAHQGYHLTADDAEGLITRPGAYLDEATPSADGIAAENLVRLWLLTGDDDYRGRADALFHAASGVIARNIFGTATLLSALDFRLTATLIVLIAPASSSDQPLLDAVRRNWRESFVLLRATDRYDAPDTHPAAGKTAMDGKPTAYVCREGSCSLPVNDAAALERLLTGRGS
jgi:uncharacterized protein YyaL (SSP411 family)